jgi:cleavage stimulation factor subunit 3
MSDAMAPIDQQVDPIVANVSIAEGVAAAIEEVEADQMQTDDNLIPSSNGDDSLMIDEAPVVATENIATEDADSKEGIVPVAELSSAPAPSINLAQTLADPLEEGTPAPFEEATSFIASAIRGSKAVVPASASLGGATSKLAQLTARLAKDPTDGEARLALLKDVEVRGDLERTREVYEEFLTVFPDAVSINTPILFLNASI